MRLLCDYLYKYEYFLCIQISGQKKLKHTIKFEFKQPLVSYWIVEYLVAKGVDCFQLSISFEIIYSPCFNLLCSRLYI